MIALALAFAAGAAPPVLPQDHQPRDLYIRFERAGYAGSVHLNADGRYVIVQAGPDRRAEAFAGRWTAHGSTGLCIHPDGGGAGKCFDRLPQTVGEDEEIRSSLDELYRFRLLRGR